ncbi:o-succinylbenzoate synthase [bacterium]|nr:MAG: o-succinylbenzoate synthase [bacterium]
MNISFHPYSLRLNKPLVTGNETFEERSGFILKSFIREKTFYSEIAPLKGFSEESTQEVLDWLIKNQSQIKKNLLEHDWIMDVPFASIRFGLDSQRLQILADADGKPLHKFINPNAPDKVKINGMISLMNPIEAGEKIEHFLSQGITTIKFKVGIKPSQEANIIRIFCDKYKDVTWRLDANQGFAPDDAVHFLNYLKGYPIAYCEQPVLAELLDDMARVKQESPIPIAADESAYSVDSVLQIINKKAADVIIVKPMTIGAISEIQTVTEIIQQAGLGLTFTTALESTVGRRLVASVASAFSLSENDYHGLATSYLFAQDFDYVSERIENGHFLL